MFSFRRGAPGVKSPLAAARAAAVLSRGLIDTREGALLQECIDVRVIQSALRALRG